MGQEKVSSRKSGAKKGHQKYQNTVAFKHNRASKLTKKILSLPIDGLCTKCYDQIEWRKKYRKYKSLTTAAKCVSCQQKNVKKAYHVLCDDCASKKNVCAKCMENKEIFVEEKKSSEEQEAAEQQEIEQKLQYFRERERRSYLRKLERGEITAKDIPEPRNSLEDFSDFTDSEDDDLYSD
ncbi:hypothetical protein BB560_001361 [Smittium megazygosporum]|uniref:Uncharacterized protein n=1 Tax=Smittium megazygosporum TaxID=133381 RepID=A0A2T9ZHT6_9FUNG|nr:hypothetical protein BB560_001361 [Smittium megazygosporum]